jgi:7,8-dihydro-6-hydroxymethylpterin-pyrophosphokinase
VLFPLAEIARDAVIPGRGRADELLARIDAAGLVKLETSEE